MVLERERGVVCEIGLAVVKSTVLNYDRLTGLQLHCILCFKRNDISTHVVGLVHSEAFYTFGLNNPLNIFIRLAVHEEKRYLDFSRLIGVVDNDNALVSLKHALALGWKLAVGDYPIILSANAHD